MWGGREGGHHDGGHIDGRVHTFILRQLRQVQVLGGVELAIPGDGHGDDRVGFVVHRNPPRCPPDERRNSREGRTEPADLHVRQDVRQCLDVRPGRALQPPWWARPELVEEREEVGSGLGILGVSLVDFDAHA